MAQRYKKIENHYQKVSKDNTRCRRSMLSRPNAAQKEKERLKAFNAALKSLQDVIPIKLPEGRKLHKKQTLQFACRYIHFLQGCMDGTRCWNDRSRFWCESDEDHCMIDAIDAAAKSVSTKHKRISEPEQGNEKQALQQQKKENSASRPQIHMHRQSVTAKSDHGYWVNQETTVMFESQCADYLRMQVPIFTFPSTFSHFSQPNGFYRYPTMNLDETQQQNGRLETREVMATPSELMSEDNFRIEQSVKCFDGLSASGASLQSDSPSETTDKIDEVWNDLSEIIF